MRNAAATESAVTPLAKLGFHFDGSVGVASRDITPPVGIYARNWGAATADEATGIHRPFELTVLTMQSGSAAEPPLVLVAFDMPWWRSRDEERKLRTVVQEAAGAPEANVMMNMSHTHAGAAPVSEFQDRPGGELIPRYLATLHHAAAEATREALATEASATLTWAYGYCDLARNRDLFIPEQQRFLTGFNPTARADATLLVGRVTDASGAVRATLVNYACHPTTLAWENTLLSPDYVGAMRETVAAHTGGKPCLFLLGACGELAPAYQYVGDPAVADRHGRQLGLAACSTLAGMLPPELELTFEGVRESGAPLALWRPHRRTSAQQSMRTAHRIVRLPIHPDFPDSDELQKKLADTSDHVLGERLERKLWLRRLLGEGDHVDFPIWAWQAGGTTFVGYPAEAYSDLQVCLRQRFPHVSLIVMNQVNGTTGYLVPKHLYNEDLYTVGQTPFASGSFEIVLNACRELVEDILGHKEP